MIAAVHTHDPTGPGRTTVWGVPEGQDARFLPELAGRRAGRVVLHIAVDDARMSRVAASVGFFAPELEVLTFPAWDCLPYDRVSPNPEIVSQRIDTLCRLSERDPGRTCLLITTINAVTQRLLPPAVLTAHRLRAATGDRLDLGVVQAFLLGNGYMRAQTVREPGEFAVRGGIIDLYPPGSADPLRLDFFGDTLEAVRVFDPISQRSTGRLHGIDLKPMAELFLDEASIARFRAGYRELFGAVAGDDPLYAAVSAGRRHAGMEHWLPLFHAEMTTLFDHAPEAMVTLDHQADEAAAVRFGQIAEFYEARQTFGDSVRRGDSPVYKPVPPDRLYLTPEEWDTRLGARSVAALSPFAAPAEPVAGIDLAGRRGRDFADARGDPDVNLFDVVVQHVRELLREGRRVVVAGFSAGACERLRHLLEEHGLVGIASAQTWREVERLPPATVSVSVLPLTTGFTAADVALITEQDILGDRLSRPARRHRKPDGFIAEVTQLNAGDLVVHGEHGIGRYDGLATLTVSGVAHDCLRVLYAENDRLYVPVENIETLSRYGPEDSGAQLDRLGGAGWQTRKARVKRRLKDMAEALMRIAAARELSRTPPIVRPPGVYEEFAARFPYAETDDQLRAIDEVLGDLETGRPMDRLICGDVGFGKTEVALRAACATVFSGGQVAVAVPTTLLARQHFRTFRERFAGLPVRVAQLSRMVGPAETKAVKQGLADGSVDVVIGTHALLSQTVKFGRLGLVVVDEEQHFGVKQKERLKQLRTSVHMLTMTATPIPRTLQLSLTGVRELSLIATPPVDRLAVRTFVLPFDPVVIREAILREHFRGGQTYYVCPRIEDLDGVRQRLVELVPEVTVAVAHGRMPANQMEAVMSAFYDGQFDVLLCTSIVESGLDVPSANTLVIHRADLFGLAQLYQLRGRIGRSKLRAYAYLTYAPNRPLSGTALQRLHVIETLDTLGAGFSLASHDMDIRGAGNLLGEEQSGHIREVGVELYQQMLQEAVATVRAGAAGEGAAPAAEEWTPTINLGMPILIPEAYVADLHVRLDLYRRLARLVDQQEIEGFAAELIDRFGPLPREVENLLTLIALKQLCKAAGVEKLEAGPKGAVLAFRDNAFRHPEKLVDFISRRAGSIRLRPDHRLVYLRAWENPAQRVSDVRKLMTTLARLAA